MINTVTTSTGNDLALDDITFSTSCKWITQLEKSHFPSKINCENDFLESTQWIDSADNVD